MQDLAYLAAVGIVVAVPLLVSGTLALATLWVRWMLRQGGELGRLGVGLTFAVTVGAAVWESLVREHTLQAALARVEVVGLVGLAASILVVARIRRSGPGAGGAVLAARSR